MTVSSEELVGLCRNCEVIVYSGWAVYLEAVLNLFPNLRNEKQPREDVTPSSQCESLSSDSGYVCLSVHGWAWSVNEGSNLCVVYEVTRTLIQGQLTVTFAKYRYRELISGYTKTQDSNYDNAPLWMYYNTQWVSISVYLCFGIIK